MSGPIEGRLRAALTNLEREMDAGEDDLLVGADPTATPEENAYQLETALGELGGCLDVIQADREEVRNALADWCDLLRKMGVAERPNGNTDYEAFQADNTVDGICQHADERIRVLRRHKNAMTKAYRDAAKKAHLQRTNDVQVVLPKLSLPPFSGVDSAWPDWWELFRSSVHENKKMNAENKFLYLKSFLRPPAADLITGFAPAEYGDAIQLLTETYGQDEKRIRGLYQQLQQLPQCHTLEDLRRMQLSMERLCRQLVALNENIEGKSFYWMLESKLTRSMLRDINVAKKEAGDDWDTSAFREAFKELLDAELALSDVLKQGKAPGKEEKKPERGREGFRQPGSNVPTVSCGTVGEKPNASQVGPSDSRRGTGKPPVQGCALCGEKHWANKCMRYQGKAKREQRLKEVGRCLRCLRPDHATADCQRPSKCVKCQGQHPLCLCPAIEETNAGRRPKAQFQQTPASGSNAVPVPGGQKSGKATISASLTSRARPADSSFQYVLLRCCEAEVRNPNQPDKVMLAAVFIDPGNQKSMASDRLVSELGLEAKQVEQLDLRGIGPSSNVYQSGIFDLEIWTADGPASLEVNGLPASHLPQMIMVPVADKEAPELLTHPMQAGQRLQAPDLIIGAQYHNQLEIRPVRELPSGFWLADSKLGPLLDGQGTLASVAGCVTVHPQLCMALVEEHESDSFYQKMDRYFRAEEFGQSEGDSTAEEVDKAVLEQFMKAVEFDQQKQRYVIELPFKSPEVSQLPSNYLLAKGRLHSTLRELRREADPKLLQKYQATMEEQASEGIIELAPEKPEGVVHYLPHMYIWRPEKQKLRVVFDASAHYGRHISLNDALHSGPTLLKDLSGILLRMRMHRIAVSCDLQAAFLQLEVKREHRDCTRFLWPANPADPNSAIQTWRFVRLTFGLNCSPFLLAAALLTHLDKYAGEPTAEMVKENLYVDNVLLLLDNPDETLERCGRAKQIFREAGFNLREFASNHVQAMKHLPPEDRLTGLLSGEIIKILGIGWDTFHDRFLLKLPEPIPADGMPLSGRKILAAIATPFDPHGLISPALLEAKNFLQRVWRRRPASEGKGRSKKDWDLPLTADEGQEWQQVTASWKKDGLLTLDRRAFKGMPQETSYQLHIFADASMAGLGIAIYLRAANPRGTFSQLIFGRSKVLPKETKRQTVPRLELHAAFLAAQIAGKVQAELMVTLELAQIWTDSENLCKWLCRRERQRDIYIDRRLETLSHWPVRHVRTDDNPADVASRGLMASHLEGNQLWFGGPAWLKTSEWPTSSEFEYRPGEEREAEGRLFFSVSAAAVQQIGKEKHSLPKFGAVQPASIFEVDRFSTTFAAYKDGSRWKTGWRKAKGKAAYVARIFRQIFSKLSAKWADHPFVKEVRETAQEKGHLSASELALGERILLREAQWKFAEASGQEGRPEETFMGKDRLLRMRGRLEHSELPDDAKWPLFVPRQAAVAKLIADDAHVESLHAGQSNVLSRIRQRFWIPAARRLVRAVKCNKCAFLKAKPFKRPVEPPLPGSRVSRVPAWAHIGLDYTGPFTVYGPEKQPVKIYVALFSCQTTRGLHLEAAADASAPAFLRAFRRFCALRRIPQQVISDNGGNFVASEKALKEIWQKVAQDPLLSKHAATKGIEWKFVVERASWRGGFYERMNSDIKRCLRACVGRQRMSPEEFATFLYEIAAVLNERPLTYTSTELGDLPLRPIDLMQMDLASCSPPVLELPDKDDPDYRPPQARKEARDLLIAGYEAAVRKLDKFWDSWRDNYLTSLRERQVKLFGHGSDISPAVGRVVLIHEDETPRNVWRMARIVELVAGEGAVRTAKLKVAGSDKLWRRAVNHLYPLELEGEEAENWGKLAAEVEEPASQQETRIGTRGSPLKTISCSVISQMATFPADNPEELDYEESTMEVDEQADGQQKPTGAANQPAMEQQAEEGQKKASESGQQLAKRKLRSVVVDVGNGAVGGKWQRQKPAKNSRPDTGSHGPDIHGKRPAAAVRSSTRYRDGAGRSSGSAEAKAKRQQPAGLVGHPVELDEDDQPAGQQRREASQPTAKEAAAQLGLTIPPPPGWHWAEECDGSGRHANCRPVTVEMLALKKATLDQLNLRPNQRLPTLLQMACARWVCRNYQQVRDGQNPVEHWRKSSQLMKEILAAGAEALTPWEAKAGKIKPDGRDDTDWLMSDLVVLINLRRQKCRLADDNFDKDGHKAVCHEGELPPTLFVAGREAAEVLVARLYKALTNMRVAEIYGKEAVVVHARTLLISDEAGRILKEGRMRVQLAQVELGKIGELIPAKVFLGSEVNNVVIMLGREAKDEEKSISLLLQRLAMLLNTLEVYQRKVILVCPPAVQGEVKKQQTLKETLPELCVKHGALYIEPTAAMAIAMPEYVDRQGILTEKGRHDLEAQLATRGVILEKTPEKKKAEGPVKANKPAGPPGNADNRTVVAVAAAVIGGLPGAQACAEDGQQSVSGLDGLMVILLLFSLLMAVGGGKAGRLLHWAWILAIAAAASSFPTVYWCQGKADSVLWDLNAEIGCPKTPAHESWRKAALDIFEEIDVPMEVQAFQCAIKTTNVSTHYNVYGDSISVPHTIAQPIDPEECWQILRRRKCRFGEMAVSNQGTRTQNNVPEPDPSFWDKLRRAPQVGTATNCYGHRSIILVNRATQEVQVPGAVRAKVCVASQKHCELEGGEVIVWEPPEISCKFRLAKANLTGEYHPDWKEWVSGDQDFALTFKEGGDRPVKGCSPELVLADQGLAIPKQQLAAMQEGKPSRKSRSLATVAETAAADTAGSFTLIQALNRTVQALRREECQQRQEEIRAIPELYRGNPRGAAKILLGRQGVQARWASADLLEVWPCAALPFSAVKVRPVSAKRCYQYVPVNATLLKAQFSGFLDPVSMILSSSSPEGPCEQYQKMYFRNQTHILLLDQKTAAFPASTPTLRKWRPGLNLTEFPQLHPVIFHGVINTPLEMLIPADHSEEVARAAVWRASMGEDAKEPGQSQRQPTNGKEADPWSVLGQMELAFWKAVEAIRWHWLNAVGLKVTYDILAWMVSLAIDKVLDRMEAREWFTIDWRLNQQRRKKRRGQPAAAREQEQAGEAASSGSETPPRRRKGRRLGSVAERAKKRILAPGPEWNQTAMLP